MLALYVCVFFFSFFVLFFFFNDTAPTEIYTLSLHDALPICIKTQLQVDLPLRTFFEQATVASLAEAVQQAQQPPEAGTAEEDLAALLHNIDALSDEEAQALLEMETRENAEKGDQP